MARASAKFADKEADAERKKWNVPNWLNKEEYAAVENAKGDRLRWEFVRRDTKYRVAWVAQEAYGYLDFGLKSWADPCIQTPPKFIRPCAVVEFPERDPEKQARHYDVLALSKSEGGLIISVDIYHPLKPQLKFIEAVYKKKRKHYVNNKEKAPRPNRKNNVNGRQPITLLRILDAYNEGVPIHEMANIFGGKNGIGEAAMRRTVDYAKTFWRRV
jgi:hypothetical protein